MRGVLAARSRKRAELARLYGATALACIFACVATPAPVLAQTVQDLAPSVPEGSQMLLEANELIYDYDRELVTAAGGVRIDYGGNRLVAERVTYNRKTARLMASGNVQIVDSQGTKIFSDEIDITDDFGDGFVNALRVETVDKTYFAAESAERRGGIITEFNNGVYTACEPCEEKPDRAPIWRLKARKIIWNGESKTVRFERSRFEMFGVPLAFIPVFEIPDPTVKRKTGFLMPGIKYKSELGVGVSVPFYMALSPTYDLTFTGTGYTQQGFLAEAEWRQRFNTGEYSVKIAGIQQNDPRAFPRNTVDRGREPDLNHDRAMIGTKGRFTINPRWAFGWDILAQTDKNFSYTYDIEGYNDRMRASEVYLTGLNERNYFDLRGMKFQVQEQAFNTLPSGLPNPNSRDNKQPWVLPSFDYSVTPDEPVAGGQLRFDVNARALWRNNLDERLGTADQDPKIQGPEGFSGRLTAQAEWKRSIITDGGLVITPLLHLQGDANYTNYSDRTLARIDLMAADLGVGADVRSEFYRYMATAGLEMSWPVLFSTTSSTHVLEPIAQVFARPNEPLARRLGLPNEDAQSFVFDATTLFERDKFSGFDRIEGGTRANIGVRYSATYANGWTANAIFGQSYQLAGLNSFAAPNLVNVGAESGLETDTSDFVGLIGMASPVGLSASASARFDNDTFEVRRTELKAAYATGIFSVQAKYAFIQAQPNYGFEDDRREVTLAGSARLHENWRVFGSGTYDFEQGLAVRDAFGFAYDDECFTYMMTLSQKRTDDETTQSIGFNISFRTLGDIGSTTSALQ